MWNSRFRSQPTFSLYRPDLLLPLLLGSISYLHSCSSTVHLSICQRRFRRQSETRHGWMEEQGSQGRFIFRPLGHRADRHSVLLLCMVVWSGVYLWVWVNRLLLGRKKKTKVSKATERQRQHVRRGQRAKKQSSEKEEVERVRGQDDCLWWRCLRKTSQLFY